MPLAVLAFAVFSTGVAFPGPKKFDFYSEGPYRSDIPRVEAELGYEPGTRITTFRDQERYVNLVASRAKDRIKEFPYGKSVQGRPLRIFAISSPKNLARLDSIRKAHLDIAEGKSVDTANLPAIVWINQCIHGNEPASFESGMYFFYNLAASTGKRISSTLDNAVVIFNPVYNPDGHERFAVFNNAIQTAPGNQPGFELQEPSIIHGRTNAYRFDMNRDRVSFSQDETRQEFAEFLRWRPQIYIDQHGQVGTYFFPPEPMSVNQNVDRERNYKWTDVIGRAIAGDFDKNGFQYFVKDTYDLYFPGYVDSSTTLSGAVGMTHETDGGKYLAEEGPDGYVLTLRRGIEKHFVSALAVVSATATNRKAIVDSCLAFKKKVVSGEAAGNFQRVVITSEDPRPLKRLQTQLGFAGIKSGFAAQAFSAEDANNYLTGKREKASFPKGSLVVDIAQSQGAFAKALLEPGQNFEKEFIEAQVGKKKTAPEGETYPGPDSIEFYDLTGWALPYAYNLKAWWVESAPSIATVAIDATAWKAPASSSVGYAMRYSDQEDALGALAILSADVRGAVATKPMVLKDGTYPAGTFLFLADRNNEGYEEKLFEIAKKRNLPLTPLVSSYPEVERYGPGSDSVTRLRKPKIGVVFGDGTSLGDVSGIWYAMERVFKLPYTAMSVGQLNRDLSEFTAIVIPSGASASSPRLKEWVSAGGTLILLEGFANSGYSNLEKISGEPQELPGALFHAQLDPRSALSYGYGTAKPGEKLEISVPVYGDTFYKIRKQGGSVVTFGGEKTTKLLTGWAWPDDTEKNLANTTWLQDVPTGRGHAFLFTQNPTDRALWPGLHKLLLNAILFGPTM